MNELKITDVVDQKALEQLERLKSELDSTFAAYKKAGDAMAEGLKIKPGPYSELISKAKDYYAAIEKVYALEDKIKRIQEEHEAVLKKLGEQGKQNVSIILQEAKANQLNADAELKVQKAETERLKQQKLINQERKKTKYTIEEANEALNQEIYNGFFDVFLHFKANFVAFKQCFIIFVAFIFFYFIHKSYRFIPGRESIKHPCPVLVIQSLPVRK